MNIIIFGVNKLSRYIAETLSESCGVYVIDSDQHELDRISSELDVSTVPETENFCVMLDQFGELKPDALLALTDSDEKNLALCKIAKNLGYPITIALAMNEYYAGNSKLDFNEIFSVDYFICPNMMISEELFKYIADPTSSGMDNFAHGAINMHTITVPENWASKGKMIRDLDLPEGVMIGLIRKIIRKEGASPEEEILFPHGIDTLSAHDEVTFVGKPEAIQKINAFFHIPFRPLKSVVIVGGTPFAVNLARNLNDRDIRTTLIEKDPEKSKYIAGLLPDTQVFNQDGTNIQFLEMEQMGKKDVFIACTEKDEMNILAASIGKKIGCLKTIAIISDIYFGNIIERAHIDHYLSPREAMANRILSIIQQEKVVAVSSLYENKAKMVELRVSKNSIIAGIPIFELRFYLPRDILFAVIQNRGRIMVADGNKVLCPGDTVLVITNPIHYNSLKKLF